MSALVMFRRRRHGLHVASVQPPDFAPADFSADTEMRYPQPPAESPWVRAELDRIAAEAQAMTEAERLAGEHQCWYGWGDTAMDYPPAHDRPYVPQPCPLDPAYTLEPYVPDLTEDIRNLPAFRDVIRARARFRHAGCRCEHGNAAGSTAWLAGQYAEATAVPALSWWALRVPPAEPVQSDDTLTWGRAA